MNTIARARPRHEVVRDIREFLLAAENLPSPKGTALKMIEMARNPDVTLDEIVRVVKTDPALTGFVLHAASAARFHGMRGAVSVQSAVQRLGLNAIRTHALVLSLISQPTRLRCEGFNYQQFWAGSLHTAILTEVFATRANSRAADDTFSLGLMANIGQLAFATAEPGEYSRLLAFARQAKTDIETLERADFGFDHNELSAVLLVDWQLPISMADIVYWQRDPEGGGFAPDSTQYLLACVLRLARGLSDFLLNPHNGADYIATARLRGAALELDATQMQDILAESLGTLREWTRLVGLPMPLIDATKLKDWT